MTLHEPTYRKTHTLQANLLGFMLGSEGELIVQQAREATGGRTARTLVKEGPIRVTVAGLRKGVVLEEHRTDAPVLLQVLSGLARVTSTAGEISLAAGGMVALDSGVSHSVEAQEDCALLLTIASEAH